MHAVSDDWLNQSENRSDLTQQRMQLSKGAITSEIKHAIKHKTKSCKICTTVAQLLQPSLAFCFILQPGLDCTPSLAAS